jgi:citrate lyase subunit beta/citryl-CoA lyase
MPVTSPSIRTRRSALYMPASNARAIEKARQIDADVVILDLEDAVSPENKAPARAQAIEAVKAGGFGHKEVVVRCNGLDTEWGKDDLEALSTVRPDGVLVPKINDGKDVARYHSAAGGSEGAPLWLMIETTASLFALGEIALASARHGVSAWVIGTNDLAKEMRARLTQDRAPVQAALTLAVAAARLGGVDILDGVYNDIDDKDGFAAACRQGVDFGFDGKTLIHPSQLEPCNRIFAPSGEEIDWAQAIVGAYALPENRSAGAIRVNGKMTERLHLIQAQRTLAVAAAINGRS